MGEYSSEYYSVYRQAQESHWWFRARQAVLEAIVPRIVTTDGREKIIDVGSGPGGPTAAVFPHVRITAVDREVSILKAYTAAADRVVADGGHLPFRPGSIEVVCAFDILEHLDDDVDVLRRWRQALVPNGWLVLTVPAYQMLWSRHDDANGHQRRYRISVLRERLESAGFSVVRMTYFNILLLPPIALLRWSERLIHAGDRDRQKHAHDKAGELDFNVRLPALVENICEGLFRLERHWLKRWRLPAGVSICAIARRPAES